MPEIYLLAIPLSIFIPWIVSYGLYGIMKPRHIEMSIILTCLECALALGAIFGIPIAIIILEEYAELGTYPVGSDWYHIAFLILGAASWYLAKRKRLRADTYNEYRSKPRSPWD